MSTELLDELSTLEAVTFEIEDIQFVNHADLSTASGATSCTALCISCSSSDT